MPPQTIHQRKQPVQPRSRATLAALEEATLQVLLKEGYARLTTTRVAERAGASVGTLYQYYPDKQALVGALKARYFGLMMSAVKEAAGTATPGDVEGLIRAALNGLMGVKKDHLELSKALRGALDQPSARALAMDALDQFVLVLHPALLPAFPEVPDLSNRLSVLIAALDGALAHAVWTAPEWLSEAWFAEQLVGMAMGFLDAMRPGGIPELPTSS